MLNNYQNVSSANTTTIGVGGGDTQQHSTDNHIFQSLPDNAKQLYVERTNKELKVNKVKV